MKNRFLLLIAILMFCASQANAYTTQSEMYSEEAMINYGYSRDFVDILQKTHARSNGQPYDYCPEQPAIYKIEPFKTIKKFINYVDPSSDSSQFLNHEIKPYPSPSDY